ncbi:MAG: 3-methyl-2-oxobutanoate dehydrogenase subunit VorB [Candidatus Omnitrophota bacterium]
MVNSKIRHAILMTGNNAIGEAAVLAGCDLYAGYPITPQNELTAHMAARMPEENRAFIQSESELSAINMVFGASLVGKRAMTSSSSPGISLKQEGISYLAGCRLPAFIVNIMRGGPGLGNISPSQADYFQSVKGGGHGDYHIIVLSPASVQEAADLTELSFDLADKYRMPVMLLGDGMLGQMMEPVTFKNIKDNHKNFNKDWALTGAKERKPKVIKSLFLKKGSLEEHNNLLQASYRKIEDQEVRFEEYLCDDADTIFVSYGITSRIVKASVAALREKGIKAGLLRPITLWPFPKAVIENYASKIKAFFVVEMSAGQMVEDVRLAVNGKREVFFYGRTGGSVPTSEEIEKQYLESCVS